MRPKGRDHGSLPNEHLDRPWHRAVLAVAAGPPGGWTRTDRLPQRLRRPQLLVVHRRVGESIPQPVLLARPERSGRLWRLLGQRSFAQTEEREPAGVPVAPGR